MKERLVEGEKSIFEPISMSNIKTNNKKKKSRKKHYSSYRGQTGVCCYYSKTNWFTWSISYPTTSLLLNIASPDYSLYQSDNPGFRNCIIKSSDPVFSSFSQIAKWNIDGMAAMGSLKPR